MMIRWMGRAAAALLLAASAGAALEPVAAQRQQKGSAAQRFKFSKDVQPLLAQAQKAQQANDHAAAIGFLNQADATPNKNADDNYMIGMLRINSGLGTNDNALIEKGLEQALASGRVPAEDQGKFIRNLGSLALQRGDNAKAAQQFDRYLAMNPEDADVMAETAELHRRANDNVRAVATLQKAIATKERVSGAKADESWYRRTLAIAYDANLGAQIVAASEALVKAYPNPTNWRDVLLIFRETQRLDDQTNLDALRLARVAKALAGERDYFEFAETATMRGLPGEAKAVIDEGVAAGALQLSKPVIRELNTAATSRVGADKAGLPVAEKESRTAKNGRPALGTGDAFLGYGQYDKAVEMYRLALQKGGVDPDVVNTRIGIALARKGDKAGAEAAFSAVKGSPRNQLARYWQIWTSQRG
ncbi:tetratricopeptide repeat protein [Thermaurantiacus sp.]